MYIQYLIWWSGWWSLIADNIGVERLNMFAAKQETGAGLGRGCGKYSASGGLTGGSRGSRSSSSSSSSSSVLLSSPHKEVRMGGAALKTCCLYLCLIFLSGVILLTSFTIQWILYSIQFSLVSPQFSPVWASLTLFSLGRSWSGQSGGRWTEDFGSNSSPELSVCQQVKISKDLKSKGSV